MQDWGAQEPVWRRRGVVRQGGKEKKWHYTEPAPIRVQGERLEEKKSEERTGG